jgi:hypothetical protein
MNQFDQFFDPFSDNLFPYTVPQWMLNIFSPAGRWSQKMQMQNKTPDLQ